MDMEISLSFLQYFNILAEHHQTLSSSHYIVTLKSVKKNPLSSPHLNDFMNLSTRVFRQDVHPHPKPN